LFSLAYPTLLPFPPQEGIEQLEIELEEERNGRREADKRMRHAESAIIEIKNDRIIDSDEKVTTLLIFYGPYSLRMI